MPRMFAIASSTKSFFQIAEQELSSVAKVWSESQIASQIQAILLTLGPRLYIGLFLAELD